MRLARRSGQKGFISLLRRGPTWTVLRVACVEESIGLPEEALIEPTDFILETD